MPVHAVAGSTIMSALSLLLARAPAYRPVSGWSPLAAAIAVLAMFAIAALAGLLVTMLVSPESDGLAPPSPRGVGPHATGDALPVLIWLIVLQGVLIALTILAAGWRGGTRRETLALAPPAGGVATYGVAMALLIVIFGLYTGLVLMLKPETMMEDVRPFTEMVRSDVWWLALIAIGIGAPLSEELIFRGFLFSALAGSRLGVSGATVITTAAWTSLHAGYSIYGLAEVFAVGLFFSWLLWKTGSLRVPIFCHAAYNTSIILALRMIDLPA